MSIEFLFLGSSNTSQEAVKSLRLYTNATFISLYGQCLCVKITKKLNKVSFKRWFDHISVSKKIMVKINIPIKISMYRTLEIKILKMLFDVGKLKPIRKE